VIEVRAGRLPPSIAFVAALSQPSLIDSWTLSDWEMAIRQARRLRVLGRLGAAIEAAGLWQQVPTPAERHLRAELRVSLWRTRALQWAIDRVGLTLQPLAAPLVLLKGAAYCAQGLSIGAGRLPSDLDILIPADRLSEARALLAAAGWFELELDAHDRDFYERFSHELPPMQHPVLAMELDVHHNIVPSTALARVDAAALLSAAWPSGRGPWSVLDRLDQALHAATHLMLDGDPADRVRDLLDLHALLCHVHEIDPGGLALATRAKDLGLLSTLRVAAGVATRWLGTPAGAQGQCYIVGAQGSRAPLLALLSAFSLTPGWPGRPEAPTKRVSVALLQARYRATRLPWRFAMAHAWRRLRREQPQGEIERQK
jgi:hypothetical protein